MASLVVCISLFCAICLINLHTFTCKRILILPFLNTSHTIILNAVASPLAARGHSVSFMWANEFTQRAISRHPNYTLLEFSTNMKPEELEEAVRAIHENFASPQKVSNPFRPETGWLSKLRNYFEMGRAGSRLGESVSKIANAVCKAVLSDKALMARLRDSRFDIALVDDFFLTRCLFLIPHLLGPVII